MSPKNLPDRGTLKIRAGIQAPGEDDAAVRVLSRVVKRSPEEVCRALQTGVITLGNVHVDERLKKLVQTLQKQGLTVEFSAHADADDKPKDATKKRPVPSEKTLRSALGGGKEKVWKKGEVIEGLYEVLGSSAGGMGRVYFVFHRTWKMMLAIKTPQRQAVKSETNLMRFMREAELWVDVGLHPNIATCYYARVIEGLPRLFIEYVDGGDLSDWLDNNKTKNLGVIVDLMLQFCHGMIHAEERGMVHRDIKPANCLLTRDGTLKITDFGLGKRVMTPGPVQEIEDEETTTTKTWTPVDGNVTMIDDGVVGSPWYMAPERFTRRGEDSISSDIYAFGVMLYEAALDKMPFDLPEDFSLRDLVKKHIKGTPVHPSKVRPDLPSGLVDIIMTCLEKKPENRYPTFDRLCSELEHVAEQIRDKEGVRPRPNLVGLKADSLNNQAISLLDLGRTHEARKMLEDAHSSNTDHLQAVYNLHTLRWAKAEITDHEVVAEMESLKIEVRETADYQHLMGLVSVQRGEAAKGKKLLARACREEDHYRNHWEVAGGSPEEIIDALGYRPIELSSSFAGHVKRVAALGFSRDGDRAFSAGEDRSIRIWDVKSGRCLNNMRTFNFAPITSAFSPDGRLGATAYGSSFKTLDLWDMTRGMVLNKFQMSVVLVAFSPDSRLLAAVGDDGTLRVWAAETGLVVWERRFDFPPIKSLAFSADGKSTVAGCEDGTLARIVFDAEGLRYRVPAHSTAITAVAVSRGGELAVTGGANGELILHEGKSGDRIGTFLGHQSAINSLQLSYGDEYLLSGSDDGRIKIWNCGDGRCWRTIVLQGEKLSGCAVSEDGTLLSVGGHRGAVRLWSLDRQWFEHNFIEPAICRPPTFAELERIHRQFEKAVGRFRSYWGQGYTREALEAFHAVLAIPGFSWSRESILMRNILQKAVTRGALKSSTFIRSFRNQEDEVTCLAPSEDCMQILSGSLDGTVSLWDVVSGECRKKFRVGSPVKSVFYLPRGMGLLTWSTDGVLRKWAWSGNPQFEFPDVRQPVQLSSDGTRLLALDTSNRPLTIDPSTGAVSVHKTSVPSGDYLSFSRNGDHLYSLRENVRIMRWSVKSGLSIGAFRNLDVGVTCFLNFPTEDRAVVGLESGEIAVYISGSGMNVASLRGHSEAVRAVDFDASGRLLLSGSDDRSLRLWDVETGTGLAVLEGHSSAVRSVRLLPNLCILAGGSREGSVRLWGLEWELLAK